MLNRTAYKNAGIADIYDKVMSQERLSAEDGLRLYASPDITLVGALASFARFRLHGNSASYVVNRQINYTNICVNDCAFCAFHRQDAAQKGAFQLSHEEILKRVQDAANEASLDELHMVGGCHPERKLAWYEELLHLVKANFPHIPIKAFTPVEIHHFAKMENLTYQEVLKRLHDAGLEMMPGGGAEIFAEDLRAQICPKKATGAEWLEISKLAHKMGISTNCTMLFGHLESLEQRLDHLIRLRALQDETGGFVCFIPLPFLKYNNKLNLPENRMRPLEGLDRLKTIAISRLILDNIPHIKAYWIMLGLKLAQTALNFGADDLDGTIVEEHIGHMAGATSFQALSIAELEQMIMAAGFQPYRRNALFSHA